MAPRRLVASFVRMLTSTRLLLATAMLTACGTDAPPALTVGTISFTEDQLLGLTESRREALAHLTAFGLAVADSTTNVLGEPLVSNWVDDRRVEILAANLTLEVHDVGDAVLEAQYLTDPQWELVVRHILFFSERWRSVDHRAEAEVKASRAMNALQAGADFAFTAAELSEEPGAEGRQGLLTPGREGSWVPEFWSAALAMEPGDISPVTETQYGYHILRLEGRDIVPFSEARTLVARAVAAQIGDVDATFENWLATAGDRPDERRAAAVAEAEARAILVPEGERAELVRVWDDMTYRWASTLGFTYGMSTDEVANAALVALANPSQGAELVRREISAHGELLDARYDVSRASSR